MPGQPLARRYSYIILLDIGAALNNADVTKAGGWVELLLAALAWYIVMAEIVNETLHRTVFPLFPFRAPKG
ncbi:MAG TPA: GPR1/FUN34/YaaH family transporter [Ktedonobacterales bacterium]|jgi:succinate-acetate transporter protein|nr:GPR1/FUN34/YaaH family transporter [Ktedonobacterales bacterium]